MDQNFILGVDGIRQFATEIAGSDLSIEPQLGDVLPLVVESNLELILETACELAIARGRNSTSVTPGGEEKRVLLTNDVHTAIYLVLEKQFPGFSPTNTLSTSKSAQNRLTRVFENTTTSQESKEYKLLNNLQPSYHTDVDPDVAVGLPGSHVKRLERISMARQQIDEENSPSPGGLSDANGLGTMVDGDDELDPAITRQIKRPRNAESTSTTTTPAISLIKPE